MDKQVEELVEWVARGLAEYSNCGCPSIEMKDTCQREECDRCWAKYLLTNPDFPFALIVGKELPHISDYWYEDDYIANAENVGRKKYQQAMLEAGFTHSVIPLADMEVKE